MSTEIVLLIVLGVIFLALFLLRDNPIVEKYYKLSFFFIPLVILLIFRILSKNKKNNSGGYPEDKLLSEKIEDLKDEMQEVRMETAVKISAAKSKNEEKIKELEGVKKIQDKKERRRRLAELMG